MINLILFELKKIFSRKSFKLILIGLVLVSFLSVYLNNKKEYENKMIYYENVEAIMKLEKDSLNYNKLEKLIKDNNMLYDFTINNDKKYFNKSKSIVEFSFTILMFLMIVLIILASQVVSNEYQDKTIKLLFTSPFKRWKIFLAKFLSLCIIATILSILLSFLFILFTIIYNGVAELKINDLIIKDNKVIEIPFIINFYKTYFILLIPIIFIMLISFCLSTMFLNSPLAVSVSLFLAVGGMALFAFLVKFNFGVLEYTFLPYLDFTIFNDKINITCFNIENDVNLNVSRGIMIIMCNSIVCYFLALHSFKKDVRC